MPGWFLEDAGPVFSKMPGPSFENARPVFENGQGRIRQRPREAGVIRSSFPADADQPL
jgi:hypothetical protein